MRAHNTSRSGSPDRALSAMKMLGRAPSIPTAALTKGRPIANCSPSAAPSVGNCPTVPVIVRTRPSSSSANPSTPPGIRSVNDTEPSSPAWLTPTVASTPTRLGPSRPPTSIPWISPWMMSSTEPLSTIPSQWKDGPGSNMPVTTRTPRPLHPLPGERLP